MSVINKMLRDLDTRRANGALPELQRQGGPDILLGTGRVDSDRSGVSQRRGTVWSTVGLLLATVALAAWYFLAEDSTVAVASLPPRAMVVIPAASAPAALAVPAPAASALETGAAGEVVPAMTPEPAASVAQNESVSGLPVRSETVAPRDDTAPAHAKRPAAAATAAAPHPRKSPLPLSPTPQAKADAVVPQTASAAAGSMPVVGEAPANVGERRLAAARETLLQAQGLWNSGARAAAVAMLGEALAQAERALPPDAAVLALLGREQARMELVRGEPAAALALLSRLEPALAAQADLWAMRGNAAQRLGQHPEAVQAYQKALQLRPGEPRWMLGSAVSLAAQGQLEAAAQQAEQARALGPVSPEVWRYLRQSGVPLR